MSSIFLGEPGSGPDTAAARRIAELVLPQRDSFIAELFETTANAAPELVGDETARTLLYSSIAENTVVLISALRDGVDPATIPAPPGAVAYAEELARRGVGLASLMRAYRIGQARFTTLCLQSAKSGVDDLTALRIVIGNVAAFIDHICEEAARHYEAEREIWISSRSGLTQYWVNRLLAGVVDDAAEAEAALEYPLGGTHLAIATWFPVATTDDNAVVETQRLITAVAAGMKTLAVPSGQTAVTTWISPVGGGRPVIPEIRAAHAAQHPMRVAVSLPGRGPAGFRRAHRQVTRLKELATSAQPPAPNVLTYTEVAPIAMLDDDVEELRHFVGHVLGALARDSVRAAELRETLRVYLQSRHSPAAAAETLVVHRNTIRYRIQQATDELGCAIDDLNLYRMMSALEICRWYGAAVLDRSE